MTATKSRFRVSYRVDRWNGAVIIDAPNVTVAIDHVRKHMGATSIRNVTVQCDGTKANGEPCGRFSVKDQCAAHRPEAELAGVRPAGVR